MLKIVSDKIKRVLTFLESNPRVDIYKIMVNADIPTKKETVELINNLRRSEAVKAEFENGKHYFSINPANSALKEKDFDVKKPEKLEPALRVPAEIVALVAYKPSEIKILQEKPQPKKKEEKLKTIQEKIEIACRRFNLIELQKRILEELAKKPLTQNEIRLLTNAKADVSGQISFLREKGLIKSKSKKGKCYINI